MRAALVIALVVLWACGHPPVQILSAQPQAAYRTLGMVSGQGENESTALHAAVIEAERLEADAIIVVGERPVGSAIIVTARAIRWLAPPPGP